MMPQWIAIVGLFLRVLHRYIGAYPAALPRSDPPAMPTRAALSLAGIALSISVLKMLWISPWLERAIRDLSLRELAQAPLRSIPYLLLPVFLVARKMGWGAVDLGLTSRNQSADVTIFAVVFGLVSGCAAYFTGQSNISIQVLPLGALLVLFYNNAFLEEFYHRGVIQSLLERALGQGGFNAVKRIDDTGFDWREQDAAQQFARDRKVEEARQADEDRAVDQIADAYAGAEGGQEPDVSPLLQGIEERRQKFMLDRARGVGKERKSSIEAPKTYNARLLRSDQDAAALEREKYKGDLRTRLLDQAEKIRANQHASPREKELALQRLQDQLRLIDETEDRKDARADKELTPTRIPSSRLA